jgi:hypothetical protein
MSSEHKFYNTKLFLSVFRCVPVHYHMHGSFHSGWCDVTERGGCKGAAPLPPPHRN